MPRYFYLPYEGTVGYLSYQFRFSIVLLGTKTEKSVPMRNEYHEYRPNEV